jgi:hypothetical protein
MPESLVTILPPNGGAALQGGSCSVSPSTVNLCTPCAADTPLEGRDIARFFDSMAINPAADVGLTLSQFRPTPTGCVLHDTFTATHLPPVTFRAYCERLVLFSRCDHACFGVAVALVLRALDMSLEHTHGSADDGAGCRAAPESLQLTVFNQHRLFASALLVAIKTTQDIYEPLKLYAFIFGVTPGDLIRMERSFLTLINHEAFVREADYTDAVRQVRPSTW